MFLVSILPDFSSSIFFVCSVLLYRYKGTMKEKNSSDAILRTKTDLSLLVTKIEGMKEKKPFLLAIETYLSFSVSKKKLSTEQENFLFSLISYIILSVGQMRHSLLFISNEFDFFDYKSNRTNDRHDHLSSGEINYAWYENYFNDVDTICAYYHHMFVFFHNFFLFLLKMNELRKTSYV